MDNLNKFLTFTRSYIPCASDFLNISEEIDKEYIKFFRTDKIVFTSLNNEPITWTRDGEYGGDSTVNTVSCLRRAIPFFVEDKSKISAED